MQVMMDGRSLYSPLFSGVFWDVQHYLMEDIKQIEVVRGPGATMWGANAFNGVINILTKSAEETQGTLITGGGGNEANGFGGVRYGGQLGERTYYRVYATYMNWDGLEFENGEDAHDEWMLGQTGFRTDTELNLNNAFTLQGDYYAGLFGAAGREDSRTGGGNVLGRWTHDFSEDSDLMVQVYFDKTHRRITGMFEENRNTFDLDAHHHFLAGEDHNIVWGINYRLSSDQIGNPNPAVLSFEPSERNLQLFSLFLQDEITVVEDYVNLTVGSKFEHNDFSGFELQPSIRVAYTPTAQQTVWAGVSRAVRTPTRIDVDVRAPGLLLNQSRTGFDAEELLALEAGYRVKPNDWLMIDVAAFYNEYEDLQSYEPVPGGAVSKNFLEGNGYGLEVGTKTQVLDWWGVRASYSYLNTDLEFNSRSMTLLQASVEGNDPHHMFRIHSSMNLPFRLEFDQVLRFVGELPNPKVPSYLELDLRLAWQATESLEVAVVGRNLLDESHQEFVADSPLRHEVERSVYGKLTWHF